MIAQCGEKHLLMSVKRAEILLIAQCSLLRDDDDED